jgi:AraC family transcriptional regulator, exoenzyme S synthesis regulatory protein ExsA
MDIINLPQDIMPSKKKGPVGIIFHPFTATDGTFKGKSILHSNAISLVMSGEKTMHFANKILEIKAGEFHFLSAGNCLASVNLSRREIFSSILVFFSNHVLTDFYLKYAALVRKIKGKQKINPEPYVAFKKDDFVVNFIASLNLIFRDGHDISTEMALLKFEELMLHLLEKYPLSILAFQASEKRELDDLEIRKAAESNITNNITVEELAFLCNNSLSTFKRRFAKIYGTSPNKWILQKRMEMAKHLLRHHHEKPGEVWHKLGYENHSSFSQSFKQIVGVTPRNFQLQQLNVHQ